MQLRPGHRGQVAVLGNDDVQIWDAPAGRLVTTIPTAALLDVLRSGGSPIAFDATGDRLAVVGRDRTVQLWDIASARLVRPPIPATDGLIGFDVDGYLVATQADDDGFIANKLAFIDLGTGAEAGSVDIGDATGNMRLVGLTDDRRTIQLDDLDDGRTFDMPATAQGWRDALCTAIGRELTAAEREIPPPGANSDPPCRPAPTSSRSPGCR
jgi:WD40 repeat protein